MVFRALVTFLLLLAASTAYGNELQVEYLGQWPEYDVLAGEPVTYSFENTNVDDGIAQASDRIGTGMQIRVDGVVQTPASGVFSSSDENNDTLDDCDEDPLFPNAWKCADLLDDGDSQEYSFTWTPPGVGSYIVDFLAFCQEQPVPDPPRLCAVNGNEGGSGTVAYITTVVNTDTDGDGVGDPTDPDDDNDGISDDLDTKPLIPSNLCTDNSDNATLGMAITEDLTCAARVSIDVLGTTQVYGDGGHLRLIAPTVGFQGGFGVLEGGLEDGKLTVISANPCPGCGGYEIGDEGPAGGIVFYVTDGGWHGLEAAPEDQSTSAPWGCAGTEIAGAQGTAVGAGAQNTAAILEQCGEELIAARLAFNYSLNGFEDWFLPSKDALNLTYENLHLAGLGNFALFRSYWSSSQSSGSPENRKFAAWTQFYTSGSQVERHKTWPENVRAIRAF